MKQPNDGLLFVFSTYIVAAVCWRRYASGADAISDSVLSLSTLIGALVSYFAGINIEGYLGFLIAVMIVRSGAEILGDTVNEVIGSRADSELTRKLRHLISKYDGVLGVYDLTLHTYGPSKIIAEAHIQVSDDTNARQIHQLTRKIATDVYAQMGIVLTLGIYAANEEGEFGQIKQTLMEIVKRYPTILQTHGFYVDEDTKVISFDVIFSFDEKKPEKVVAEIIAALKAKYPDFDYHAVIDTDVSD